MNRLALTAFGTSTKHVKYEEKNQRCHSDHVRVLLRVNKHIWNTSQPALGFTFLSETSSAMGSTLHRLATTCTKPHPLLLSWHSVHLALSLKTKSRIASAVLPHIEAVHERADNLTLAASHSLKTWQVWTRQKSENSHLNNKHRHVTQVVCRLLLLYLHIQKVVDWSISVSPCELLSVSQSVSQTLWQADRSVSSCSYYS